MNAVAVGLILVAFGLFSVEMLVTRHGLVAFAGVLSLVLADLILAGSPVVGRPAFGMLLAWIGATVLAEYDRGVVFRLGRVLREPKGPGIVFVFWPVDALVRVSLRMVVAEVPPQDVITRDNVSVRVTAVIYFRNSRIVAFPLPIELFGAFAGRTAPNGKPQPDGSKEPSYSMS